MPIGKRPIVVIGAGFSGTIATLHLLRHLPPDQPVVLVERAPEFARGLAYATGEANHLLNVRATNMSALADQPRHFVEWLQNRTAAETGTLAATDAGLFASRGLYGRYLREILDNVLRDNASHAPLKLLSEDVVDVVTAGDGSYVLHCASGLQVPATGIVLAVGNLPPDENPAQRICANPWGEKAWRRLEDDRPVLIVGTGLTMVDLAISLRRRSPKVPLLAMSRGGLLPASHAAAAPWPTPHFTMAEETSLSLMMARLRDEAFAASEQGIDWRAVVDSLRPVTAMLWSRLPVAERRRFLRHARRFWDVHRHRMAPPHAEAIDEMRATGALTILRGRITEMRDEGEQVRVRYQPFGAQPEELAVQRVIIASGLEQVSRTRDPLMRRLQERGLVRLDEQGLGLAVTDGLNVIRGDGSVAEHVWALGPIVRGVFWECVAVPDIRVQAGHVAVSVVAHLRETAAV